MIESNIIKATGNATATAAPRSAALNVIPATKETPAIPKHIPIKGSVMRGFCAAARQTVCPCQFDF